MTRRLTAILLMTVLTACAAPRSVDQTGMYVISGVPPFSAQVRNDDCGAVALASLLEHAGDPVPAEVIDREIYDPTLRGTLLMDMENYAARRGAAPHSGRGDLDLLRELLAADHPVLLPIDLGISVWRRPHYIVVFGYDQNHFLAYLRQGELARLTAADLDRRWRKTGRLYLYLE